MCEYKYEIYSDDTPLSRDIIKIYPFKFFARRLRSSDPLEKYISANASMVKVPTIKIGGGFVTALYFILLYRLSSIDFDYKIYVDTKAFILPASCDMVISVDPENVTYIHVDSNRYLPSELPPTVTRGTWIQIIQKNPQNGCTIHGRFYDTKKLESITVPS